MNKNPVIIDNQFGETQLSINGNGHILIYENEQVCTMQSYRLTPEKAAEIIELLIPYAHPPKPGFTPTTIWGRTLDDNYRTIVQEAGANLIHNQEKDAFVFGFQMDAETVRNSKHPELLVERMLDTFRYKIRHEFRKIAENGMPLRQASKDIERMMRDRGKHPEDF